MQVVLILRSAARRRLLTLAALAAGALAVAMLTGCGGSKGLSASSSCEDFMSASPEAQNTAVMKIATDMHAPNAVTPLGRPNVNYLCANDPSMSLGDAILRTG